MNLERESCEPILNKQAEEALQDLKMVLEAKRIPDEERDEFVNEFKNKVNGVEDEDMIDLINANIMKDVMKMGKEIKSKETNSGAESKERTCSKCGSSSPSSANFCGECGGKF